MILFMWQDDIIGVARFIDVCLERVSTSAGPPMGDQASDDLISPELAGNDVMLILLVPPAPSMHLQAALLWRLRCAAIEVFGQQLES